MPTAKARQTASSSAGLRVQTLVRLRWLAIFGQLAALLLVRFEFGFELPFWPALGLVLISAWLNIVLMLRHSAAARLKDNAATAVLAFDIAQLALLLFLTGGLTNPFAILFLAPVTVSAAALPSQRTLLLGVLTLALVSLLAVYHLPLPWFPDSPLQLAPLYIFGIWMGLVSGIGFTALYVHKVAREARDMAAALTATELALARQQQLYALDGLAAAAAHELSTPLGTIAVVSQELRKLCRPGALPASAEDQAQLCEDLALIASQAVRCREILAQLADHRAGRDEMLAKVRLSAMLEEIVEPLRGPDLAITLDLAPEHGGEEKPPVIRRDPGLLFGLGNIIENACDFAETEVVIIGRWDDDNISITVHDDGPGFAEDIISRLGEPFVTSRARRTWTAEELDEEEARAGMGLGFFIAKTLLERSGATISIANRARPAHGAIVRIDWPRSAIEVRREEKPSSGQSSGHSQVRATASAQSATPTS